MSQSRQSAILHAVDYLLSRQSRITIREIAAQTNLDSTAESDRKAILRVLRKEVEKGRLIAYGKTKGRSYGRPVTDIPASTVHEAPGRYGTDSISFSPQSLKLAREITRPVKERKPVGYNREFLESYVPNKTSYLSEKQLKKLHSLGQVQHEIRPAGTYARQIMDRLLIDLSFNSSRLEGNTYSLLETKKLLEAGKIVEGKDLSETQMILNHKAAIEYIIETADDSEVTAFTIKSIHALLSDNLLGSPVNSGRLRSISVGIGSSVFSPLDNPHNIVELFHEIVDKFNSIEDPFEQSIFALIQIPYLQPFEDVNKRTSRLVGNIPFVRKNLRPLAFSDVDPKDYVNALLGIYERNDVSIMKDLFEWAYERSSYRYTAVQQSLGQPNLIRLKYRAVLQEVVRNVVLTLTDVEDVVPFIKEQLVTNGVPETDREYLQREIELEVASLHEGNIARFRLLPGAFHRWKLQMYE